MPGFLVRLVLATSELGVDGLHSVARLVLRLLQSKLNLDVDQVSVDVANYHEHRDGFVEGFVLGPGNGTTNIISIGQNLRAGIGNLNVTARFLGRGSYRNSGGLSGKGHFLSNV